MRSLPERPGRATPEFQVITFATISIDFANELPKIQLGTFGDILGSLKKMVVMAKPFKNKSSSLHLWVLFVSDVAVTGSLSLLDDPSPAILVGSLMSLAWLMCLSASRGTINTPENIGERNSMIDDNDDPINIVNLNLDTRFDAFKWP